MYIKLVSGTRFSAHQEMTDFVEALTDSVVDFSYRGSDNWFLMESSEGLRYINYIFLVCTLEGWSMKLLNEAEHIPNVNAPLRLIRQSTCQIDSAVKWQKLVRNVHEQYEMEKLSISSETTPTCSCRSKSKAVGVIPNTMPAVKSSLSPECKA